MLFIVSYSVHPGSTYIALTSLPHGAQKLLFYILQCTKLIGEGKFPSCENRPDRDLHALACGPGEHFIVMAAAQLLLLSVVCLVKLCVVEGKPTSLVLFSLKSMFTFMLCLVAADTRG